jgi:probable F420-dependent oxidoreductase
MHTGVAFPTTDIGNDPVAIKDFAQAVEAMGYDHITLIDHVIQTAKPVSSDWRSFYSRDNSFHEPFVMFGFLAGVTTKIEFATAILILPQRPTVLVAKQAAELDVLTGGRLRLGVGIGWNDMEFDALGQDFKNRGRRMEEQIDLMRQLWTNEVVTFKGEWHDIDESGINPLPVQKPIPVWFGAFQEVAIKRAGRMGDGWFHNPRLKPGDEAQKLADVFRSAAADAGRDPTLLGMDCTVHVGDSGSQEWAAQAEQWRDMGASHVTVRTMYAGMETIDDHIEALRKFKDAWTG